MNGATGAIGSAVVQYLKFYEIHITAVCDGENSELVRLLGADKIIDYKKEDFTKDTGLYDMVIDAVGKSTFWKCRPIMKPKGIYTSADGIENVVLAMITPLLGGKKVVFSIPKRPGFFPFIRKLIEEEKFTAVIDRKYPYGKIIEAYEYVSTGQKVGNVIIEWA